MQHDDKNGCPIAPDNLCCTDTESTRQILKDYAIEKRYQKKLQRPSGSCEDASGHSDSRKYDRRITISPAMMSDMESQIIARLTHVLHDDWFSIPHTLSFGEKASTHQILADSAMIQEMQNGAVASSSGNDSFSSSSQQDEMNITISPAMMNDIRKQMLAVLVADLHERWWKNKWRNTCIWKRVKPFIVMKDLGRCSAAGKACWEAWSMESKKRKILYDLWTSASKRLKANE